MYHAYDALSDDEKQVYSQLNTINSASGLEHYLEKQNLSNTNSSLRGRKYRETIRPLVRSHPETGRRALYFGNQITVGIVGWNEEDSKIFISKLTGHACQARFQYRHKWEAGDAVLWDNRRVLHAGTPYDVKNTRRLMYRTTFREIEPIKLAE